jgi:hypothetical protein
MPIPYNKYSIRDALTKLIDLTGPLSKKTIKELAAKCEDNKEKEE